LKLTPDSGLWQLLAFAVFLTLLTRPLGSYMAGVFEGRRTLLSRFLTPVERLIYRLCGVDPGSQQDWTAYAASCLAFSLVSGLFFYVHLRLQGLLPLNPQGLGTPAAPAGSTPLTPDLAFNISASFMTNTSWQSWSGETTLSYLSQMLGIAVQSFTSAAAGMAVAVALIRSFARQDSDRLGNFWVDVTRSILYVLLPLSFAGALFLSSQGVVQSFRSSQKVVTVEGAPQTIPLGPVASQEPIKLLSSDGGGFFNANSAHPFENPTPLTNFVEMLLVLTIPAAFTSTLGGMVKDRSHGWTLFAVMMFLFLAGCLITTWSEQRGSPAMNAATAANDGGNWEGKEVRFGIPGSSLFSVVSTASSDGAVNSMHDSYTPLSGLVQLFNLKTGEVIFGGTGSGLISMMLTCLVTIFIAGLMVGRTPEYLGKKIEAREMKLVMISLVATGAAILVFSAATVLARFPVSSYWNPPGAAIANLGNRGPHGLGEILYANASAVGTNGGAWAGLNANTPWFNVTLGLEMMIGRFLVLLPALGIAGSLVRKRAVPITRGTVSAHGFLFGALLVGTIAIVTALTFFPTLSLAPIAEHYLMQSGAVLP
jgi:K+-transporting ATPase ATPase A chain